MSTMPEQRSPQAEKGQASPPQLGLTTTKSPFIENAQAQGQLFIEQPYELYSEENQETWQRCYQAIRPKWSKYANSRFMTGVENLMLTPDAIPRLDEINNFLAPLSGFKAKAVSGYVPAYKFFDCLRNRAFPTTITIRDGSNLDYLPEPDIFHDIAGHVPMHTDRRFSDVLVRFGEVAKFAAVRAQELTTDRQERTALRGKQYQSHGQVLLVYCRVWTDARARRNEGLRQRTAQFHR